jgi:sigma-B regulation protein RsbU (phosphoserine phosphatase)
MLTDYVAPESLQRLQDEFVSALGLPLRICSETGEFLTEKSPSALSVSLEQNPLAAMASAKLRGEAEAEGEGGILLSPFAAPAADGSVPIELDGEILGRIVVADAPPPVAAPAPVAPAGAGNQRLVHLMAAVIARRYNRQKLLRTRIGELAALYRLTAEFTSKRDLQSVLDLVCRTVVEVLSAKACAIRLLNEDRTELVAKAVANLSPKYLNKGPVAISASQIDREVMTTGKTVYIADLRIDPRTLYPAEAEREGIVSGLCAPLTYKGRSEGVIRVYTGEVHEFDWYERSLLEAIAAQAAAAIVNSRLYEEAVRGEELRRTLRLAGEVQRRMIPGEPPKLPGLDVAALYVPCFELGGDFYDFLPLGDHNLGVAVCDVVGKGVRASLLMASIRASLRAHATNIYDMARVMERVNRDLCIDTAISDFATMFYGVIDVRERRFTYANAGHPPPLLIRGGRFCHLSTGGGVLGIDPEGTWKCDTMIFRPGDAVVLFTDGLAEALDFHDEPFGRQRIELAAQTALQAGQSADGVTKHILWEMRRFVGLQAAPDDLTLIVIRVL